MTNKAHTTRCATIALAATLALGSTPLLAQDVTQDVAPAPPTATVAPPPSSPTIVVPEVAPAPVSAPVQTVTVPGEVVQPTPPEEPAAAAPAEPAERAAPAPRPAASTRTTTTTRAPAAETMAPAPAAPDAEDEAPADSIAGEVPFTSPIAAAPEPLPELAPTTEEARSADNTMAVVLGVLAALALIVIGFFALRRKGPKRYAAAPRIERPVPASAAAPEPAAAYTPAAFGSAAAATRPASGLSHAGAAVSLPREVPKTYAEREALIQRMVEAKPDRANPFRSKRARYKRARLILASLGRDFRDGDPWIDLSQYPTNWPELARRQSAAA